MGSQHARQEPHTPPCNGAGQECPCASSRACTVLVFGKAFEGAPSIIVALTRTTRFSGNSPPPFRNRAISAASLVGSQCLILGVICATTTMLHKCAKL